MTSSRICASLSIILFFLLSHAFAQKSLDERLKAALTIDGTVAVTVLELDNAKAKTVSVNGDKHLPMQSVYKFPLGLAVLDQVDKGRFSLDQKIRLDNSNMLADTWSPMREKYPNGDVDVTLKEVITFTVAHSDNNGCDILFRLLGGPAVVDEYIHELGIKEIAIRNTEEEMHRDRNAQFNNWATTESMTQLLKLFHERKILSPLTHEFMMKTMIETSRGTQRLKGQLPARTPVAHRPGSSGAYEDGITAAANDVGIITLPNGKSFSVAVFVSNTKANNEMIDSCMAGIAKTAWDYFNHK